MSTIAVPRAFIWRRLHSLMGLWLAIFLIEHLLTNSQAALWLGDNGQGFVRMVNMLHNLPYLQVIESLLIGIPILIHAVWGIKYLLTSKFNSAGSGTKAPRMPYARNRAYTWQRITSWILLIGLILHVAKFRFLEYPQHVNVNSETFYLVKLNVDEGLYTVADRLKVKLYDHDAISNERRNFDSRADERTLVVAADTMKDQKYEPWEGPIPQEYSDQKKLILTAAQRYEAQELWVNILEKEKFGPTQVIAVTNNFGTSTLMTVRDTFKSPIYVGLYTIFVLAACFHAFNGFWTFLITWGLVLKMAAQRTWATVAVVLMLTMMFLGLAAVWGTYWMNLRY